MAETTDRDAGRRTRDGIAFGVIIIVVGIGGLAAQLLHPAPDIGGWVVAAIGLGLLGGFFYTHEYGYLVPGSIMTGLGVGIVASQTVLLSQDEARGGLVVLGLGLGFLGIYVIGALVRVPENHWWPFIPGGILTVVGSALVIGGQAVNLLDYWGIGAIALGLFVFWRAFEEQRAGR